jgi:1-deoxy-D-xylulose-5-phosphate reductoisomerase
MSLEFEPPDRARFPCLGLAYRALERGGTLPAVLNAANEEAVAAFLAEKLPFVGIPETIEAVMAAHTPRRLAGLEDVLAADAWARHEAQALIGQAQRAPVR